MGINQEEVKGMSKEERDMALTKEGIELAKEMGLIIEPDQNVCRPMNIWKERYLELVKTVKEEHHWAAKTGMILANETNTNVEADNFLRGVTYVTLELTKKIKEMEKEDENDTTEF